MVFYVHLVYSFELVARKGLLRWRHGVEQLDGQLQLHSILFLKLCQRTKYGTTSSGRLLAAAGGWTNSMSSSCLPKVPNEGSIHTGPLDGVPSAH
jgi:hypothetical protein